MNIRKTNPVSRLTFPLLGLVASAFILSACVTATAYKPAAPDNKFGYSQQKLQSNRFRVTFAGNSKTDRETVQNYLLYRAAELTLEQGGDYFVVEAGDTERNVQQTTTYLGPGLGYSPFFFGAGFGGSAASNTLEDYTAYGTIAIHSGKPPSEQDRAYDARELKENLEAEIKRES